MKTILQSLVLLFSFVAVFIWQKTPLSQYTIQVLGALIFIYILISFRKKGAGFLTMGGEGPWGIFILNTIVLSLVFATGNFTSSLFFLLYFLGFGIAFVFEPLVVFIFVLGVVLVFLPNLFHNDVTGNLIKLGSLLLISPLAFFFGREYQKDDKKDEEMSALEERTKDAANTIAEDVEEVLKEEKSLKKEDVEKLNDILEETEALREESKK